MQAEELYSQILGINDPWEISSVSLSDSDSSVTVHLSHAPGISFSCPTCGDSCKVYDHSPERTWRHLDTCQYYTYLKTRLPRVNCPKCGIQQVRTSWCSPNSRFTLLFTSYAVACLRNSQVISRTAEQLRLSQRQLSYLLRCVVDKGMTAREVSAAECEYLAIDEKSCKKGHKYVTIIYSQKGGRVLAVAEDRTIESVKKAYQEALKDLPEAQVTAVSMDMWAAFASVTQEVLPTASIVHDRFHVVSYLNDAVDTTRKKENKQLITAGNDVLKKTKYLWLTNPENLSTKQKEHWDIVAKNPELATYRAWQLKENFKQFFEAKTPQAAQKFFDTWHEKVTQLANAPLQKVATMLKEHLNGLLTYAQNPISNAIAEGTNSIIQQIKAKARGFNSPTAFRYAILFYCGGF